MAGDRNGNTLSGIVVVDKPAGPTSFEVVRRVRQAARVKKIGHTGTLDPMATGVLILCLGSATKLAPFLQGGRKVYEGRMLLGQVTDTGDVTGRVTETRELTGREAEQLPGIVPEFVGRIEQTVPEYSAVKIEGRPAYSLARAGEKVPPRSRMVEIYELTLFDVNPPYVSFRAEVSKGTYIRSLAADIGSKLGVGACLESLRRTVSRPFDLHHAVTLEEALDLARQGRIEERLVSPEDALSFMPEVSVSEEMTRLVQNGQPLPLNDLTDFLPQPGPVRVQAHGRGLLAVYEYDPQRTERERDCLTPVRVLVGV